MNIRYPIYEGVYRILTLEQGTPFIQGGTYLQGTAGHRWHCTRKHSCHCLDSPETGCTAKGKYGFSGSRCGRCTQKEKEFPGYLP